MRLILIFLVVNIGFVHFVRSDPIADRQISVRLATGMEGGTYYEVARSAEEITVDKHVRIVPIATQGSWESLLLLREGRAEFALAQWDAVQKYVNWTLDSSIMAVRPLYMEYLHIIIREPLELLDISEFAGKRIFLGPERSGTAITAKTLLEVLGVSPGEYQRLHATDLAAVPRLLQRDSLDIAMHVGPLGSPFVQTMLDSVHCKVFSLNLAACKRITHDIDNQQPLAFGITEIPRYTYRGQTVPITTVMVPSVLMSLRDLPPAIVSQIDTTIMEALDSVIMSSTGLQLNTPIITGRLPRGIVLFDELLWPQPPAQAAFWLNLLWLIVPGILVFVFSYSTWNTQSTAISQACLRLYGQCWCISLVDSRIAAL